MLALAAVTIVPWIPATPSAPVVPPVAPPCRLAQLRVGGADPRAGVFFNGAGGSLVGSVSFRNTGPPCSLLGRPRVRLLARARQLEKPLAHEGRAPDVLPPPFSVRALPTGRSASVEIWWSNWCGPIPAAVAVTLPRGGMVRLPVRAAARCDAPQSPSTLSVGTFVPVVPQPKESTRLPFRVGFDRTAYRATAGTVLRFRVTLRNTSRHAFRFDRCPLYYEQLGPAREIHVLNCRGLGALPAGAARTFAMELRLPRTLRRGRQGLFWELGLGTYLPQSAGAPALVSG